MTREEGTRGWVFFALYFLVFPFVMAGVQWVFEETWIFSDAASNVMYYLLSDVLVFLVFWSFLQNGLNILLDYLPENLFAFVTGLAGTLVLRLVTGLFPYPVENPILEQWPIQYAHSPWACIAVVVILMPIVEEVLFRGLLFGSVRKHSRAVAWGASVVLYMVYNVWTFAFAFGDMSYLALALQYLPMAVGLTWCYDRGGSVWSPIALHVVLNAITLFTVV